MSSYFSFSQSEAKKFLAHSKFAAKALGLKLVVEQNNRQNSPTEKRSQEIDHSTDLSPLALEKSGCGKLLIVIPRRVANAVGRNLIRRRIKAIYSENKLFNNNKHYALFVYPEAKNWSFDQFSEFLKKSL